LYSDYGLLDCDIFIGGYHCIGTLVSTNKTTWYRSSEDHNLTTRKVGHIMECIGTHNRIVTGETKDKVEKSSGGRYNRKKSSETVEDLQTEKKAVCCRMTHPVLHPQLLTEAKM
jgi:hypothetical protein